MGYRSDSIAVSRDMGPLSVLVVWGRGSLAGSQVTKLSVQWYFKFIHPHNYICDGGCQHLPLQIPVGLRHEFNLHPPLQCLSRNLWPELKAHDAPKVTEPNLRFPAVFCENLRFPARICGFLRFPSPSKCWNFQGKR